MNIDIYYSIMNLLDKIALSGNDITDIERVRLDHWLKSSGDRVEDIADANDCGICTTWDEVITGLRNLYATGERI